MFKVEFYVDDKRIAQAIHALTGIAVGDPKINPVVNAVKKNGKLHAKTDGDVVSLFMDWLKQHKDLKELKADHFRAFCNHIGRPVTSYSAVKDKIVKAGGILRRIGTGSASKYKVVVR